MLSFYRTFFFLCYYIIGTGSSISSYSQACDDTACISIHLDKNSGISFDYFDEGLNIIDLVFKNRPKDTVVSFKVKMNKPFLLFDTWGKAVPYLVFPGDSIQFMVKTGAVKKVACLNHPERNNELMFFNDLSRNIGPMSWNFNQEIYSRISGHDYRVHNYTHYSDSAILRYYDKCRAFLDGYSKKNPVSDFFYSYAKKYLRQVYIRNRLYPFNTMLYPPEKLPQWYLSQLYRYRQELSDDSSVYCDPYHSPVFLYDRFLSRLSLHTSAKFYALYDSAKANFKGKTRDYLLYLIMKQGASGNYKNYASYVQRFEKDCRSAELRNRVVRNYDYLELTKDIGKQAGKTYLSSAQKNIIPLTKILDSLKGNLVLIDFWASWCAPCRAEMPYAQKLKKAYVHKPIVFLYVSMDKNFYQWHKAAGSYSDLMNEGNSYLMINGFNTAFSKKYKIHSIPRYILIGKNGEIISADAPRPEEDDLRRLINERMEER